ncbi:MAG: DUF2752 domain-containing protein [Actinomycetes bacterium]
MRPARLRAAVRASPELVLGAALLGAVGVVGTVDPHVPGRYPVCPWHALTGTWCPGCGGLRAVHDLVHGHVVAAAGENLLVVTLVPVLVLWWLLAWWSSRHAPAGGARPAPGHRERALGPVATVVVAVVAVGFAVLRNLPVGAGLAP